MTIKVFKPFFFTKDGQLKAAPISFDKELIEKGSSVASEDNLKRSIDFKQEMTSYSVTYYKNQLINIIEKIEVFNTNSTIDDLRKIEDGIHELPFVHWREELLGYTTELRRALDLKVELARFIQDADKYETMNRNNKLKELDTLISRYPFEDQAIMIDQIKELKSRFNIAEDYHKIEQHVNELELMVGELSAEPFSVIKYKEMLEKKRYVKQMLSAQAPSDQKNTQLKKVRQLQKNTAGYQAKLFSLLRREKVWSETALKSLEIEVVNSLEDNSRALEMISNLSMKTMSDQAIKEEITEIVAFCLAQEAETAEQLNEAILSLEYNEYINLRPEDRLFVINRFFYEYRGKLETYYTVSELLGALKPFINHFHEDIDKANTAATPDPMIQVLKSFNLFENSSYTLEEINKAARYLLLVNKNVKINSIATLKQYFDKGIGLSEEELSSYEADHSLLLQTMDENKKGNEKRVTIIGKGNTADTLTFLN
ncbi:hypothetical protein [Alkalihalophilus marmarensis]|uniref:Uncharacterized protein n=1 Tax=Alkalihalophilus marmarensis DSM 21297 TaxID=1188261 RepID=U6SKZ7_9BACI|nr:hypothetical protein [Alkalihalophilus marmarensis]ERN52057.1 hypothetical protein A33I_18360 [Alkalihalophilus marmarensis DSM 21297]